MHLGANISYLRKQKKMTQEQFAERMCVTRQTVSRWESDEVIPELEKLVEMCAVFSCRLDALVTEDLPAQSEIYSPVKVRRVSGFRMAKYVMISPNPEDDVNAYMEKWAIESGLKPVFPNAMRIGWDFPYVSQEQKNRFGLRGYAAAFVMPHGFETACPGVQYAENREADYAVITITEPFIKPFERIPKAYHIIMEYLQANNFKEKPQKDVLSCFEHEYEKDGTVYMDVYIHAEGVIKADAYTQFH